MPPRMQHVRLWVDSVDRHTSAGARHSHVLLLCFFNKLCGSCLDFYIVSARTVYKAQCLCNVHCIHAQIITEITNFSSRWSSRVFPGPCGKSWNLSIGRYWSFHVPVKCCISCFNCIQLKPFNCWFCWLSCWLTFWWFYKYGIILPMFHVRIPVWFHSNSSSLWRNVLRGHAGLYRLSRLNSLPRSRIVNPYKSVCLPFGAGGFGRGCFFQRKRQIFCGKCWAEHVLKGIRN